MCRGWRRPFPIVALPTAHQCRSQSSPQVRGMLVVPALGPSQLSRWSRWHSRSMRCWDGRRCECGARLDYIGMLHQPTAGTIFVCHASHASVSRCYHWTEAALVVGSTAMVPRRCAVLPQRRRRLLRSQTRCVWMRPQGTAIFGTSTQRRRCLHTHTPTQRVTGCEYHGLW